jgi:hypothetical protein
MELKGSHRQGETVYLKINAIQGVLTCFKVVKVITKKDEGGIWEIYYKLANGETLKQRNVMRKYEALTAVARYYLDRYEKDELYQEAFRKYKKLAEEEWSRILEERGNNIVLGYPHIVETPSIK